ncbi:MAG: hypothetical protein WKH64_00450 [Chloroflexia bacterium]
MAGAAPRTDPFGRPAAHVAMLRHETTVRRKWLDDKRFLDLLGATNLIPAQTPRRWSCIGRVRAADADSWLRACCSYCPPR